MPPDIGIPWPRVSLHATFLIVWAMPISYQLTCEKKILQSNYHLEIPTCFRLLIQDSMCSGFTYYMIYRRGK